MLQASRMKSLLCLAMATGAAFLLACGSEAPRDEVAFAAVRPSSETLSPTQLRGVSTSCALGRGEVSFARDVEPILMSGCSGEFCHGRAMTSASRAHAFLVNQPAFECDDKRALVTPYDPDHSYVLDKILGRNLCSGHVMPRGFENRLSPREIQTIADWICEGAPND
jgi:hypothetical protein